VPRWFSTLSELIILSIYVNLLRQEDIELLGALPVLRFLELEVGTTEERLVVGDDQHFGSLAEFKFKHYTACCLLLAQGMMPKLQRLQLYCKALKREVGSFDHGLGNLASLKHVKVKVNCEGARISEVEDVETKIRDAIDLHPNHPTLVLSRKRESAMITDDSEEFKER
jgi:disease resistance protein RPM1